MHCDAAAGSNSKAGVVMHATIHRVQAKTGNCQMHICHASTVMQGLTAQPCGMHSTTMARAQQHCMHANNCSHGMPTQAGLSSKHLCCRLTLVQLRVICLLLQELLCESDARAPSWQYPQHVLQDQSQQLISVPLSAAVAAASAVFAAPSIPEAWPSFLRP